MASHSFHHFGLSVGEGGGESGLKRPESTAIVASVLIFVRHSLFRGAFFSEIFQFLKFCCLKLSCIHMCAIKT